jgi:hypothetical protein
MTKVVINTCFGGFGLSDVAFEKLLERKGIEFVKVEDMEYRSIDISYYYRKGMVDDEEGYLSVYDFIRDRSDADLIGVIEELGLDKAAGKYAKLKIVEVPDDVEWHISEYDGAEHVAENHRTWS